MEVTIIRKLLIGIGLIAIPLLIWLSLLIGSSSVSPQTLIDGLLLRDPDSSQIVYHIRMPRVLLTLLTGLTLAISGFLMQTVSQNRLVSPSMLGLVDGALLGVVMAKAFNYQTPWQLAGASIVGAFLALGLVFGTASLVTGGFVKTRLVLIGIIIGNIVNSLANLIAYKSSIFQQTSLYFLGSVSYTSWQQTLIVLGIVLVVTPFLIYLLPQLEGFYLDEEVLLGIGKPVRQIKIMTFLLAALLSALTISVVGKISFVGLIVPNIVYLFRQRGVIKQFFLTALIGVLLILIADIGSKVIRYPYETPLSFVVSLIGLPFFFWIIKRQGGHHD